MRQVCTAIVVFLSVAMQVRAQEGQGRVTLPLAGVDMGCCSAAAQKAIAGIEGVRSVEVNGEKGAKFAHVALEEGAMLDLAQVSEVLASAAEKMGKAMKMDVQYVIDNDRLLIGAGAKLMVTGAAAAPKLREAILSGVKGLEDAVVSTDHDMATVVVQPSGPDGVPFLEVAGVIESAGGKLEDVLLPAARSSFTCPMCGGDYAEAGQCAKCGMDLVPRDETAPGKPKSGCGCCGN